MNQLTWLFVGCLTYLVIGSAAGEDFADLAKLVCKTTNGLLSSGTKNHLNTVAGITGVVDFLDDLPSKHKLYKCRGMYIEALKDLVHVVEAASNDVCGEEKLALMEDFHRRYVSKLGIHEKERKHKNKAPRLAKLFFMQYASRVSFVCEQAASKSLAGATIEGDKLANMERLRKFTDNMLITDFSKGYDGLHLFWNMIESLNLNKRDKFAKYLDNDGENRVHVQMRNAQSLAEVQAYCRHQLKPVYSKSLLPVLRLVDMGYYPESNSLMKPKSATRDLLFATQVCEIVLPIGIHLNETLTDNQVVALTKEAASQLSAYQLPSTANQSPRAPLEVAPSALNAAELNFAGTKCSDVKAQVDYRGKIMSRLLKRMVKEAMNVRKLFKGFKLFRRDKNEKLEAVDDKQLEKAAEQSVQAAESGMMRRKREVVIVMSGLVAVLVLIIIILLILYFRKGRSGVVAYY